MRVLFLDIDGVLNSLRWRKVRKPITAAEKISTDQRSVLARRNLDPVAIGRLETIVQKTRCMVVLSSAWREMMDLPRMTHYLAIHGGFTGFLAGATPSLSDLPPEEMRGAEIQAWIDATDHAITQYAILDDEVIIGHDGHFVHTSFDVGLTDGDVARAIAMLTRDPKEGARE